MNQPNREPSRLSVPWALGLLLAVLGIGFVRVTLAEDSERPDEFWVFRPTPQSSGTSFGQEAGQITDSRLRSYLETSK
jgi:hypothetical protein